MKPINYDIIDDTKSNIIQYYIIFIFIDMQIKYIIHF